MPVAPSRSANPRGPTTSRRSPHTCGTLVELAAGYSVTVTTIATPGACARSLQLQVHCIRNGLRELEGRGSVEAFDVGDELPGGAVAFEVDASCADETALHIAAKRALACADERHSHGCGV